MYRALVAPLYVTNCWLRSNSGVSSSLIVALDLEILLGYLDKLLACSGSQTFPALRHTPARPPRVRYSPT